MFFGRVVFDGVAADPTICGDLHGVSNDPNLNLLSPVGVPGPIVFPASYGGGPGRGELRSLYWGTASGVRLLASFTTSLMIAAVMPRMPRIKTTRATAVQLNS